MAATRFHRPTAEPLSGERSLVGAATSYLQIQTGDDATARVVALGSGSIRVGRGIQCEVRLNQVGLGDVQCMIRRRGDDWHLQPVGPPGRIWIDGRSADQQQPLPIGAILQVGRFRLTILPTDPNSQQPGSFDAPILVDPASTESVPAATPVAEPPQPSTTLESPPQAEPPMGDPEPAPGDDRVKRWQSRLNQRDQWLKDRQSEKRWEARWKAAGETIRARSTSPAAPGGEGPSGSPVNEPPSDLAPSPSASVRTTPPNPSRPVIGRPTIVRPFEPRPVFGPTRRIGDSDLKSEPRRVPIRPNLIEPIPEIPANVEPVARVVDPLPPIAPGADPLPLDEAAPLVPSVSPATVDEPGCTAPVESVLVESPFVPIEIRSQVDDTIESPALAEQCSTAETASRISIEPVAIEPGMEAVDLESVPVEPPRPQPVRPSPRIAASTPAPVAPTRTAEVLPPPKPRSTTAEAGAKSIPPRAEVKDWPTARAIFAAQGIRATEELGASHQAAGDRTRKRPAPEPTEAVRPESWTIPLWLGWFPSLGLVLVMGMLAAALTVAWLEDASSGNLAIRLATRPNGTSGPIDSQPLPKLGWWRTTASHLAAWALVFDRVGNGEDRSADARTMELEARSVSPLGARARFVAEPILGQEADAAGSIRLGPTRDVVTLTAMAHRLRRENKKRDALRAYRSALLTASATHRSTLDRPEFREDSQINRYDLPHSALLAEVARDMVESADWTAEEWAEAVPHFGPAQLAVALAIRAKDPAEAERWFRSIVQGANEPLDPRFEVSEHHAAVGEALAEQRQWADAIAQYRRAIDEETRDLDRRVWWFNLAEIARKTGDVTLRNQAIESAKGVDLSDDVTQRAANAHRNPLDDNPSAPDR